MVNPTIEIVKGLEEINLTLLKINNTLRDIESELERKRKKD